MTLNTEKKLYFLYADVVLLSSHSNLGDVFMKKQFSHPGISSLSRLLNFNMRGA